MRHADQRIARTGKHGARASTHRGDGAGDIEVVLKEQKSLHARTHLRSIDCRPSNTHAPGQTAAGAGTRCRQNTEPASEQGQRATRQGANDGVSQVAQRRSQSKSASSDAPCRPGSGVSTAAAPLPSSWGSGSCPAASRAEAAQQPSRRGAQPLKHSMQSTHRTGRVEANSEKVHHQQAVLNLGQKRRRSRRSRRTSRRARSRSTRAGAATGAGRGLQTATATAAASAGSRARDAVAKLRTQLNKHTMQAMAS